MRVKIWRHRQAEPQVIEGVQEIFTSNNPDGWVMQLDYGTGIPLSEIKGFSIVAE